MEYYLEYDLCVAVCLVSQFYRRAYCKHHRFQLYIAPEMKETRKKKFRYSYDAKRPCCCSDEFKELVQNDFP